ncbi:hypothetical protein JCM18899A_05690 [Nocardioides sp. AN3]
MNEPADDHLSEAALLEVARRRDREAYAELFDRHVEAARRYAVGLVGDDIRADDLVADAFTKVMVRLDAGAGPTSNFRAYLFTTIRNSMLDSVRRDGRERAVGDLQAEADLFPVESESETFVETSVVMQALKTLPARWREALWRSEVLKESQEELAAHFGIKPNAAAVLCYRAREGLRQAYLAKYVARSPTRECERHSASIPAYIRGQLSARKKERLEEHLDGCAHCRAAVEELAQVNSHLGALVVPALLLASVGTGLGAGLGSGLVSSLTSAAGGSHATQAGYLGAIKGVVTGLAATAVVAGSVVGVWSLTRGDDEQSARHPSTPSHAPSAARALPPAATTHPSTPSPDSTPLTSIPPEAPPGPAPGVPRSPTPLVLPPPLAGAATSREAAVAFVAVTTAGEGSLRLVMDLANVTGYSIGDGSTAWSCRPPEHVGTSLRLTCRSSSRSSQPRALEISSAVAVVGEQVTGHVRVTDARTTRTRRLTISTAALH